MRLMDRLNPRGEAAWQAGGYIQLTVPAYLRSIGRIVASA